MNWTSGYMAEIDYTHGYYPELSPVFMTYAALNRRVGFHTGTPFRYLELGFGQGLSLNIHAATCPGEFWGNDFNPAQAANAKELAEASGSGARILDLSFAELAERDDLPEFDVIALHGIWSWISEENRALIVDIAKRKLAAGGMFFISYNCTPGWAPVMPLRHLLSLHAELAGSGEQGIVSRIDGALAFAQQVADTGALYFQANSVAGEKLKKFAEQDRNYLAHEYFNKDWLPMAFSQVAEALSAAKLNFAASASMLDHIDVVNLTPERRQLLLSISHPVLRESVRDYLVNQRFRKDIFVKGNRPLSQLEQFERYRDQGFVLTTPAAVVPLVLPGAAGEASLQESIYQPLIEALADGGYSPKTLAELMVHPNCRLQPLAVLVEALVVLAGAGHVRPVQAATSIEEAGVRCKALNAHLCRRARYSEDATTLASPVLGGGVAAGRMQQLFLLEREAGRDKPEDWPGPVWETLEAQGQRLLKDGKPLTTNEENLAELHCLAKEFSAKHLPILQALGVA